MLRGPLDYASNAWREIEKYTFYFTYEQTILNIAGNYPRKYRGVIKKFDKKCSRQVRTVKKDDVQENPGLIKQNVLLLKNAIELWNTAKVTSDAVSPMLFHYSFNCFNSFILNTFLKWTQRTRRHGLGIIIDDELENIAVEIKSRGMFPRLIDLFTLFGVPVAFSKILPINDNGDIKFIDNDALYQDEESRISITKLLEFNRYEVDTMFNIKPNEKIIPLFIENARLSINSALSSFLLIFIASSISRYRPTLWQSILPGADELHRDFMEKYSLALTQYSIGENGFGLVSQVRDMLWRLSENPFQFYDYNSKIIF